MKYNNGFLGKSKIFPGGSNILRTLGIAIILSLLMIASSAIPASAAYEEIWLSPSSGEIGEYIYLDGWDFDPDENVYIYFSSQEADESDYIDDDVTAYELLRSTWTDSDGSFVSYFYVPDELTDGDDEEDVHGGRYYVYATYPPSERIRAVAVFTVIGGELTIKPKKGPVGTRVEIDGEDFGDREDITVEYDGDEIDIASGDDETDRDGEFTCTIIIPESYAGDHTITVIGDDSDIEAEAEFTVKPEITISPTSGTSGTEVTVTGTGFGDESYVTIYFDDDEVADEITDEDGSFEASFVLAAVAPGTHDIEAEDEDDNSDTAKFTTATSISISQTSGYVGTEITVRGTGFRANKTITITLANAQAGTATTDTNGSFRGSFLVPSLASGTYKVKVSDGVNTKDANFTILLTASLSPTTSQASPGHIGTELTVSGTGFKPKATVTIKYDETQVATASTDAKGAFSVTFTAPKSKYGEHKITATDATNTKQFTFIMESEAPPVPVPLLPETGTKAKSEAYFDWKDVTDPSGVTYTLQIASDADFNNIVLEKAGLTDSEYTITKEEKLESVTKKEPYHWRVRAIDGASNESRWSGAGSFYVGFTFAMPQWAIYTLCGVVALLFGIIGFWLGRRTTYY